MAVRCNRCYWQGEEEDLILFYDKENKEYIKACPKCETDEYLMDIK